MTPTDIDRLLSKVGSSGECWIYGDGSQHSRPQCKIGGRMAKVHIVLWTHYKGRVPGRLICVCHNEVCVNPGHFSEVISGQHVHTSLTPEVIEKIKAEFRAGRYWGQGRRLAEKYNTSPHTISRLRRQVLAEEA